MDICFGPTSAIGGIRCCLMFVDKATRQRRMYPLKNLTTSLHLALKEFVTDVGVKPKLIRTDFDKKLIAGPAKDFLLDKTIRVESAPPKRQQLNGLVERAWQSAVIMARNWLKSALLPSKFWYFALKQAIEISNISPTKINNKITTPFTEVYKQKVDYRQLFPMFALSYIKQETESGGSHKNKWSSQSLKPICVGTCPNSDSLLFYHPPTKTTLSCANSYHFDTYLPSGPQFEQLFDGRFRFTTKSSNDNIHIAPTHEANATVFVRTPDDTYDSATVLHQPHDEDSDYYIVQMKHSGDIVHVSNTDIVENDPTSPPTTADSDINGLLPWLTHDAKITIALPQFDHLPKQGFLQQSDGDSEWYFIPGRSKTKPPIHLPQFQEKAISMAHNQKLFQGWMNHRRAQAAQNVRMTSNILSHHIHTRLVSATSLINNETPISLLRHSKLHPNDKLIWDKSYAEEYNG